MIGVSSENVMIGLGKANRTRCFNPFSRKLLTVAVGVEWLKTGG